MPCRDGRDEPAYQISELKSENNKLTRMLCVTLSSIDVVSDLGKVINHVQYHHPSIRLGDWWVSHRKEDIKRLKKDLDKYSDSELLLIKNILKDK